MINFQFTIIENLKIIWNGMNKDLMRMVAAAASMI